MLGENDLDVSNAKDNIFLQMRKLGGREREKGSERQRQREMICPWFTARRLVL